MVAASVGSLTIDQFNYLADQTNDFAVNEKGEPVGEDGMMSAHPPSFVRNRLKDQQNQLLLESSNGDTSHLEKVLIETGTIAPGSHLQRQKRASPSSLLRQHDLEQMYQELEMEMTSVLTALNAQQGTESGNAGGAGASSVEMGKLGEGSGSGKSSQVESGNGETSGNGLQGAILDGTEGKMEGERKAESGTQSEAQRQEGSEADAEKQKEESRPIDPEVEDMFLSEEEQKKKRELWLASNGDWLKRQEEKRKEQEQSGKKVTKRKKRTTVREGGALNGRIERSTDIR